MESLSDSLVSFFKVMIDDDFSRVLYLPPKFARRTPHLLNKKTYLENLNEQRWNVLVSKANGSLAFIKGWSEFSTAHNLQIGDVVVFHYFIGNYFIVQVFNRTACDVRGFPLGNGGPRKRRRYETLSDNSIGKQDSPDKEDSNDSVILASGRANVQIREDKNPTEVPPLAIVPAEKSAKIKAELAYANFEDPEIQFLSIGRDTLAEQREDRTVIDLSNYEMLSADAKSNRQLSGTGWCLPYAEPLVICKAEPEITEFANLKQEMKCHVGFPESANGKEATEFANLKEELKCHVGFPESANGKEVTEFANLKKETSIYSDVKDKIYDASTAGSPSLTDLSPKYGPYFPNSTALKSGYQAGKCDAPLRIGNAVVKVKKEIKTEPFEEIGLALVTASAIDLHCRVKSATSLFLDLPGSLPLFTSRPRAEESKLVILRDTAERVWPVLYHHKPNMKYLTTGWSAFQKANNIKQGDTCIFKVDTEAEATYEVSIVRKENKPT
ncbi:unnamed protein product [Rhodiola kirilowii]